MLIRQTFEHKEWSGRIKRRGVRRVAREMKVNPSLISRIVNNKYIVTEKMLERLRIATNNLRTIPISSKGGKEWVNILKENQ